MTSENSAAMSQMLYHANSKSVAVSYLLWFFLGSLGGHRFYNGRPFSGITQLALTVVGFATLVLVVGFVFLAIAGIWVLIDAFLIPGWVSAYNNRLAHQVARG